MVTPERIASGISTYVDNEILPQLPTIKAIGLGTVVSLYVRQIPDLIKKIPGSIGITDESGMIDIDTVRDVLRSRFNEPVSIDIPMIGKMTFDQSEVDKLCRYIKGIQ